MKNFLMFIFVFSFFLVGIKTFAFEETRWKNTTCRDTDGGSYPYTFGKAILVNPPNDGTIPESSDMCYSSTIDFHSDSCVGEGCQVMENYCVDIDDDNVNETYNSTYYNCYNGCNKGACILTQQIPSITVLSPSRGEVYKTGQQIKVKWKTTGITSENNIEISLYNPETGYHYYLTKNTYNDGSETFTIPSDVPLEHYQMSVYADVPYLGTIKGFIGYSNLITVSSPIDEDCPSGEVYNSTIAQKCPSITPSIIILSPKGGETYKEGEKITVKWKTENISKKDKSFEITLFGYDQNGVIRSRNDLATNTINDGKEVVVLPKGFDSSIFLGKNFVIAVGSQNYLYFGSIFGQSTEKFTIKLPNTTKETEDLTPRISYWQGKVNQHFDVDLKTWQTDPDGVSGAEIDKLTYCKKWYPSTESVVEYKKEIIETWRRAWNEGEYKSEKMSYECVLPRFTKVPEFPGGYKCYSLLEPVSRTLKIGVTGSDVKSLQRLLGITEDGVFGKTTSIKVKEWQKLNGLKTDGIFGSGSIKKSGLTYEIIDCM